MKIGRLANRLLGICLAFSCMGFGQALGESSDPLSDHAVAAAAAEKELARGHALIGSLDQRDLETAIALFGKSARQFSLAGLAQKAASSELEAGDTLQMMSKYQLALSAYRLAISLSSGLPSPRCAAISRMARTYASIGRNREAKTSADEAVTVCATLSDQKAFAYALEAEGEAEFWAADMPAAKISLTRARQLASEANDADTQAQSTMLLAQIAHLGDRDESNQLALDALNTWTQAGNAYGVARGHLAMAFFAADEGSFGVARCHCEKALPVLTRMADKDNQAVALNTLGLVASASGDTSAALDYYRQARRDFVAAQDDLGESESILGLGQVLVKRKEYAGLLPLYDRGMQLARATNNRAFLASALLSIGNVHRHTHQYEAAEDDYQRSVLESRAAGNTYAEGLADMRLAELYAEQGRFNQALALLEHARALKQQTNEREDLARIAYLQARIYLRRTQFEQARSEIEVTIGLIESQRLRIEKFESRAQYFSFVHEYYALYIQVLMELHRVHPDAGYEKLAFEAAEKSKVRALLDLMNDSQEAPDCERLLEGAVSPASLEKVPASPQLLTLPQIQSEIGDGQTGLLEYAFGDTRLYAWLLDGEHITAFDLGPGEKVGTTVRAYLRALEPAPAQSGTTALAFLEQQSKARTARLALGKQLGRRLLTPIPLHGQKRMLIIPDGPLQYLPFSVLPGATEQAGAQPVIATQELSTLPSASVLVTLRKAAAKRIAPKDEVTVFADPVFEKPGSSGDSASRVEVASDRSRGLRVALKDSEKPPYIPSLPASRQEALAIEKIVGSAQTRLALGFDANRDAVLNGSLARQRIVHFATHGIIDSQHPERSGLVLSMVNRRGEYRDGYLRMSDIYGLKLSADLVVLSSCESALGKDLGSEGILGLPRGFLYAGARSVIASLWKVDDEASAILMGDLYSRMKQGETPAAALRGAQLDMARSRRFSEPEYWAAFVLQGEYR